MVIVYGGVVALWDLGCVLRDQIGEGRNREDSLTILCITSGIGFREVQMSEQIRKLVRVDEEVDIWSGGEYVKWLVRDKQEIKELTYKQSRTTGKVSQVIGR